MDLTNWNIPGIPPGRYKLGLTNHDIVDIDVKRAIVSTDGGILYLEDVNDRAWNFKNVIWFEEA